MKKNEIEGVDYRHSLGPGPLRDHPDRPSVLFTWLKWWLREMYLDGFESDDQTKDFHREARENFKKAVPFVWTEQMWTMGLSAAETMPDSIQRGLTLQMPFDQILFAWKHQVTLWTLGIEPHDDDLSPGQTKEEAAKAMEAFWMLIHRHDDHWARAILYGREKGKSPPPGSGDVEMVWMKSAVISRDNDDGAVYRGLFAFLESPYVTYNYPVTGDNRAERKRISRAKDGLPPSMTDPRFVMLRRALIKREQGDQGSSVQWTHQWLVSGHWRDQWLPSSGSHRMTWIAPYVKGPPDLPLKTPVRLVAR